MHDIAPFSWPRFLTALIAAPLLVTALTFWALIPVYALIIGGPFYLLVGIPLLRWFLSHYRAEYIPILGLAMIAQLLVVPLAGLLALWHGDFGPIEAVPTLLLFGCLFGGVWSLVFTLIYRRLIRDI